MYNDKIIQDFNDVICGHLCISLLKMLSDKVKFKNILAMINADRHICEHYIN
jgi:hypothetical protein